MPFVRDRKREFKTISELDKIENILIKYIDTQKLLLKSPFKNDMVNFVKREGDLITLTFSHELFEKEIIIYTFVSERYVQFKLKVKTPAGGKYAPNTYNLTILSCSLAAEKRKEERFFFETDNPKITKIMVSKIQEKASELKKSISAQVIIKDYLDRMSGFELKKPYFGNEKDIPPEVIFAVEKKESLFIPDLKDVKQFITTNEPFFKSMSDPRFKSDIEVNLRKMSREYVSLAVEIINFHSLIGEHFPFCYLELATKDRPITESESAAFSRLSEEISEKIHKGNYREFESTGKVLNISMSGALVETKDENLIRQLTLLDGILFNLVFKLRDPIRISALVVYIYQAETGIYHIGLQFKGSYFGPEGKRVIEERIKSIAHSYSPGTVS
ncbi:MAG TPA: PilZ domain-containing protein [Spirochaetota bacterium]|nr:PilZ domain-containing protein [Spirochaetota bacterium]HPI89633.1 PilZ domain-containing protein [Spirochaetota bacterium]HPR49212.1 PilZ domain-containing protein [Spirochaetota bacterium]